MPLKAERKKILLFVDWFYPGYKAGGPIQSCRNFIAALEEEYQMAVVTSDRDWGDEKAYEGIRVNEWNEYTGSVKVFYAAALNTGRIRQLVEETSPDFIYLNSMFSSRFAILPLLLKWRLRLRPTVVVAPRGMLQAGALRFKPQKKKLFIQLLNLSRLPGKLVFHATDEQEKQDIQRAFPAVRTVFCIPNFPRAIEGPVTYIEKQEGRLFCAYVSRLAAKKNLLYFLQLLEKLPPECQVSLAVRGEAEDKGYWQQCEQQIKKLPAHITVRFDGPIQNDHIIPFLQEHHLFILPTLGENFGHAVFESFAAGRPVLLSDKTPWRGLEARKAGWDIPLENETGFLAALQKAAAMDQQQWKEWCDGARQMADDFIQQSNLKQQYLKLFN